MLFRKNNSLILEKVCIFDSSNAKPETPLMDILYWWRFRMWVIGRCENAIGEHDDLLTMVKKRKLRWYGHISRSSGMAKTILQGTKKGARRRGRQKKRWEDNIKEWTRMGFGDSLRAAEDREGWKGIVATSSVVPRRPPRLRDWDEMRCRSMHGPRHEKTSFVETTFCPLLLNGGFACFPYYLENAMIEFRKILQIHW